MFFPLENNPMFFMIPRGSQGPMCNALWYVNTLDILLTSLTWTLAGQNNTLPHVLAKLGLVYKYPNPNPNPCTQCFTCCVMLPFIGGVTSTSTLVLLGCFFFTAQWIARGMNERRKVKWFGSVKSDIAYRSMWFETQPQMYNSLLDCIPMPFIVSSPFFLAILCRMEALSLNFPVTHRNNTLYGRHTHACLHNCGSS